MRLSPASQTQLRWIYGIFLSFWFLYGIMIFAAMVWPVRAHAQGVGRSYRRPAQESDGGDIYRRLDDLEEWRRAVADPKREEAFIRLERIESAESVRDKVVVGFVVPVILIMIKEIGAFLSSRVLGGNKPAAG